MHLHLFFGCIFGIFLGYVSLFTLENEQCILEYFATYIRIFWHIDAHKILYTIKNYYEDF